MEAELLGLLSTCSNHSHRSRLERGRVVHTRLNAWKDRQGACARVGRELNNTPYNTTSVQFWAGLHNTPGSARVF